MKLGPNLVAKDILIFKLEAGSVDVLLITQS